MVYNTHTQTHTYHTMYITYENKKLYLYDIILYTYVLILGVNGAVEHIQTALCISVKNSAIFKSVGIWSSVHKNRIVKTNTAVIRFIIFLNWMGLKWSTNKDEMINNMKYRYYIH